VKNVLLTVVWICAAHVAFASCTQFQKAGNSANFVVTNAVDELSVSGDSTFQAFVDRVNAAGSTDRSAIVDSFMSAATFPYVEGNTAVFIHRGSFSSVTVPGDANGWDADAFPLERLADTDFWYRREVFESTARLDYKFVVDGSNWILDPWNRHTVSGGAGPNSELAMLEYEQPTEIIFQPEIEHGTITDTLFASSALGNSRQVQIFLPAGYDTSSSYGMMLFHDGAEYLTLGSAGEVIDNLIASGEMKPIVGVFVPPIDRSNEYAFAQTDAFESFIVDELMPWVMSEFAISEDPGRRGTAGASYGGLISTQLCYRNPETFGLCGLYSPAYRPHNNAVMNELLDGEEQDITVYMDWGTYEESIANTARVVRDELVSRGYDLLSHEWYEGHSWGSWRAHLDDMLLFFFGAE